ncbi:maltokinase N-terminal cap-like domain-containing protein [Blastococcus sp. SYSU D00695]
MATIHDTTLTPGKLELLTAWLPRQPWYRDHAGPPVLVRSGGFRLDDPAGEVGIEFLLVTDTAGPGTTYATPLTYRGAPPTDDGALVGTAQHGVLGARWISDAVADPVAMQQLLALVAGDVVAAHQTRSDTADPTVTGRWTGPGAPVLAAPPSPRGPGVAVEVRGGGSGQPLVLEVVRVLDPAPAPEAEPPGTVTADVRLPDGEVVRRTVAVVRRAG